MPLFIPPELVNEIVHHILDSTPSRSGNTLAGENSKPKWDLIEAFTLSSRTFRLLALAAWFRCLYLKHLHCVQSHDSINVIWDLSGFKRLSTIRIDWLYRQLTRRAYSMQDPAIIPFTNVDSLIRELDIRGVRYPSPMTLIALTSPFVHLVTLKLESLRIWCGLCHTCTLVRFPFPAPTGFLYEGGLGLPVHYARADLTLPDIGSGLPSPGLSAESNENMWTGECDRCMSLMYEDVAFRKRPRWRSVYVKPLGLKKVQWTFWKYMPLSDVTPYTREELGMDDDFLLEEDSDEDSDESSDASSK
ncbi:hypothetical protein BDZ97DRAFT_1832964 [Flammula alnicola]|nr:hypothetical protein BDZ97DRAFT_1832964 [Flammula alnicola]